MCYRKLLQQDVNKGADNVIADEAELVSRLCYRLGRQFRGGEGVEAPRRAYPSGVTDKEWMFVLPYLLLFREDAKQHQYVLRELFNALRYVVRTGCTWRYLPHDLPPWAACYQQWARWRDARVEALTDAPTAAAPERAPGHPACGYFGLTHLAKHAQKWPPRRLRWR